MRCAAATTSSYVGRLTEAVAWVPFASMLMFDSLTL
jgi:hypothetical protein